MNRHNDKQPLWIIKISGKLTDSAQAIKQFAQILVEFYQQHIPLIVIHGGGQQLDNLASDLAIEQQSIDGRRVTCSRSLTLAKYCFAGLINTDLSAGLSAEGLPAIGLTGVDDRLILARKRPSQIDAQGNTVDFGWVGDIQKINSQLLQSLLAQHYLPVIAPLAVDNQGQVLNVNADGVASHLAVALSAARLVLCSDVDGIYADPKQANTLYHALSLAQAKALLGQAAISGGMKPKLTAIIHALTHQVSPVDVINGHYPQRLLSLLHQQPCLGTHCKELISA